MLCNCIEDTEKLIIEKTGDPEAYMHVYYALGEKTTIKPAGMHLFYHEKKKDGTFKQSESKIAIVPTFCPFCGKKYEEDTKEQQST